MILDQLDKLEYPDLEDQMDHKENLVKQALLGKLVHRALLVQMAPLVKQGKMAVMVNLVQQAKLVKLETLVMRDLLVFLEYVVFVE